MCKGRFFRNLVVGDHGVFYYIKWEFIKKSLGNPVMGGVATKKIFKPGQVAFDGRLLRLRLAGHLVRVRRLVAAFDCRLLIGQSHGERVSSRHPGRQTSGGRDV